MGRQFWNVVREALRVDKIKGSLTIPAASYSTFRSFGCIEYTVSDANDNKFISLLSSTGALTAELYIKPMSTIATKQVAIILGEATPQLEISLLNNVLTARVWKAGVATSVSATGYIANYAWNHVAVTYDNVTIKLFINGVKVASGALAGASDAFANFVHVGQSAPTTEQFVGRIAEIKLWNVVRTEEQILSFYRNPRNVGMDDIIGLVDYYKLNGVSIDGTGREKNQVTTSEVLSASQSKLTTEDSPPLIFGASFAVVEFPITMAAPFSFQYPVTRPEGCNGVLVIQWITGVGTCERRKFWSLNGVDINPDPAIYMGEQIPATFTLEWWNVDGAETLEVPDAIILRTSKTTNPTTSYDSSAVSSSTLTPDITLGEPYPLTYPLTFNTAQAYT